MDFIKALETIKQGKGIKRKEWKGVYLFWGAQTERICRYTGGSLEHAVDLPSYDLCAMDWEIAEIKPVFPGLMFFGAALNELMQDKGYISRASWAPAKRYLYKDYTGRICCAPDMEVLRDLTEADLRAGDWEVKPFPKQQPAFEDDTRDVRDYALRTAAKPLIAYLRREGCPHDYVLVTQTDAEVLEARRVAQFEAAD